MDLIATQALELDIGANAIIEEEGVGCLFGAKVDLIKTELTLDRNTVKADYDLAIANYSGYVQKTVTWGAPTVSDDGEVEYIGTVAEFRPTSSVVTNQVYGVGVKNTGNTKLYMVGTFDAAPLPMAKVTDSIIVTIRFRPKSGSIAVTIS